MGAGAARPEQDLSGTVTLMRRIVVSAPARLDLREQFAYLAESDFDKALQFFDATRQTFADLARMTGVGSP